MLTKQVWLKGKRRSFPRSPRVFSTGGAFPGRGKRRTRFVDSLATQNVVVIRRTNEGFTQRYAKWARLFFFLRLISADRFTPWNHFAFR